MFFLYISFLAPIHLWILCLRWPDVFHALTHVHSLIEKCKFLTLTDIMTIYLDNICLVTCNTLSLSRTRCILSAWFVLTPALILPPQTVSIWKDILVNSKLLMITAQTRLSLNLQDVSTNVVSLVLALMFPMTKLKSGLSTFYPQGSSDTSFFLQPMVSWLTKRHAGRRLVVRSLVSSTKINSQEKKEQD